MHPVVVGALAHTYNSARVIATTSTAYATPGHIEAYVSWQRRKCCLK